MALDGKALRALLHEEGLVDAWEITGPSEEGAVWVVEPAGDDWFGTWQQVAALLDEQERDGYAAPLEDWLDSQLEETELLCGEAPAPSEVLASLGDDPAEIDVERWLLTWERRHRPDAVPEDGAGYLSWFEPGAGVKLLLLPSADPWSAAVYVGHFGDWAPDQDLRPALIFQWCRSYGVEPVANWDTMQQFIVRRPPLTLEQAWDVAGIPPPVA